MTQHTNQLSYNDRLSTYHISLFSRQTPFLILWFTIFSVTGVFPASIPNYDLTTLAMMSEAIVLVERIDKQNQSGKQAADYFRIEKSYNGSLLPDEEIEVCGFLGYSFNKRKWDKHYVFFLKKHIDPLVNDKDTKKWFIVHSGLRLLSNGTVYRFMQSGNPGPFVPSPQRREFPDESNPLYHLDSGAICLPDFESDLRRAITRVEMFHFAKTRKEIPERNQLLLQLLGKPTSLPFFYQDVRYSYLIERNTFTTESDPFACQVLHTIAKTGHFHATLDAIYRSKALPMPRNLIDFPIDFIYGKQSIAAARDPSLPLHKRIAAIWLMRGESFFKDLVDLLKDPNPQIRIAVTHHIGSLLLQLENSHGNKNIKQLSAPLIAGLRDSLQRETDPLIRTALLSASTKDIIRLLAKRDLYPPILIEGCIRDQTAHFVVAFVDSVDRSSDGFFLIAQSTAGGQRRSTPLAPPPRLSELDETHKTQEKLLWLANAWNQYNWSNLGGKRCYSYPFRFFPPLPTGQYRMHIEAHYYIDFNRLELKKDNYAIIESRPCQIAVK